MGLLLLAFLAAGSTRKKRKKKNQGYGFGLAPLASGLAATTISLGGSHPFASSDDPDHCVRARVFSWLGMFGETLADPLVLQLRQLSSGQRAVSDCVLALFNLRHLRRVAWESGLASRARICWVMCFAGSELKAASTQFLCHRPRPLDPLFFCFQLACPSITGALAGYHWNSCGSQSPLLRSFSK